MDEAGIAEYWGRASTGLSPDGGLLYLLLERDGFRCFYAKPIDPSTGKSRGEPFLVMHPRCESPMGNDGLRVRGRSRDVRRQLLRDDWEPVDDHARDWPIGLSPGWQ